MTAAARGAAGLAVLTAMRLCSDRRADPKTQLQAAKFLILRGFGTPELARAGDGLARYAGLRRQVLHLLDGFLRDEGGDAT